MEKTVLKKVFDVIGSIFVGVAIIIVVFFGLSLLLPRFDHGLIIIKSGSMEPKLSVGSVAIISAQDQYTDGEIITFTRSDHEVVTHRIVAVEGAGTATLYRVKGDANEEMDVFPVESERVMGKVLFGVPWLGYISMFARTPVGLIILIGIPTVWIIYEQLMNIKKEVKKKEDV